MSLPESCHIVIASYRILTGGALQLVACSPGRILTILTHVTHVTHLTHFPPPPAEVCHGLYTGLSRVLTRVRAQKTPCLPGLSQVSRVQRVNTPLPAPPFPVAAKLPTRDNCR